MADDQITNASAAAPAEKAMESSNKMFAPVGAQVTNLDTSETTDDEPQVVDEIESLCMNCEDNVSSKKHVGKGLWLIL